MAQHAGSFGRYEITGTVTDEAGQPVPGAAVQIGKTLVYTNQSGQFSIGVKAAKPQPIKIPLDQFAAPGSWQVIDAPTVATPDVPIIVTVKRF